MGTHPGRTTFKPSIRGWAVDQNGKKIKVFRCPICGHIVESKAMKCDHCNQHLMGTSHVKPDKVCRKCERFRECSCLNSTSFACPIIYEEHMAKVKKTPLINQHQHQRLVLNIAIQIPKPVPKRKGGH